MNPELIFERPSRPAERARGLDALARRVVLDRLRKVAVGTLQVSDGNDVAYGSGAPTARVVVHDARTYTELALGGTIGAAEAYMQGLWDADDLTALIRVLLRNRTVLDGFETGTARLKAPLHRLLHWLNRNTRGGSRRNIAAHYDLGNDFFALWLDDSMMYSSAIFPAADSTLEEASAAKNELICRKLALSPDDRLLEIGTGWGGFALHAARRHGARVTSVTISREQHELARRRVHDAGLADRVDVLLADYRELDPAVHGRFDKLVSIEMIEAVGHKYQPAFFAKCAEMLAPHGAMLLQAITIADQQYERARRSVDFIQRYIFPGSCLTSITHMAALLTSATDMRIAHLEDIGPHYARTLSQWRARFEARLVEVRALGYPESFVRMWRYYFCYCEAGFLERVIGDVHLLLVKPGCRLESPRSAALPGALAREAATSDAPPS
ncbi:MAG TPA: cyclopropane-fatty-acyl-phospholipid synthase family protein [Gammaproteobacteria bacterium]|nr:cyclopropane-fatty-acyl-phospholipid synthase family protein [Gammaproteobacteria bacterium]